MKYLRQFAVILGFCLAGELLNSLLPLPIPAGVYGMLLLTAALQRGIVQKEQVQDVGRFLTGSFLLLFIPGAVGIVEQLALLRRLLIPVLLLIVPVTALVFAAAGGMTQRLLGRDADG